MLSALLIRNVALIEAMEIAFTGGLSVITGETGAGKSIVIGALGLLLGDRASGDMVRTGADKAVVEGTFTSVGNLIAELLARLEIDNSDELLLRREISAKGQSRSFINDSPVPLTALKECGDLLVDLHGQHEHQSLLRAETHLEMLDAFAGVERNRILYQASFTRLQGLLRDARALREKHAAREERTAVLAFQAREIDALAPQAGEDEAIAARLARAQHGEQLFALTAELQSLLYDGDRTAHDLLSQSLHRIASLAAIDPAFQKWLEEGHAARAAVDEIAAFVRRYHEQLEFDPVQLEEQRVRLFAISGLKKKYGATLDAVIAHRAAIDEERRATATFEADLARIDAAVTAERATCSDAARRLSEMRSRVCPKLERAIVASLQSLGIASPSFSVAMQRREIPVDDAAVVLEGVGYHATGAGIDLVEFLLSTNAGEPVKPLVKVASGGEVSRVMLALKTALAKADRTPVLVFDEIDVGISGRIAQTVGAAMRELAAHHQVIAITHLPQIAGFAQEHYVVEKIQRNNTTATTMRHLSSDERLRAIASLLSGDTVTEASLKSAKELMR